MQLNDFCLFYFVFCKSSYPGMNNFYLIGFTQAVFFIVLILTKKKKVLSDYVLSFFILLLGGQLFYLYSYNIGWYSHNPWILITVTYYWTFLGPTLFLYTVLIIQGGRKPGWKLLLYILPPVLIVTIGFFKYIVIDGKDFFSDMDSANMIHKIVAFILLCNSPLFYILTILKLRKHSKQIKRYFSYSRNVDLKWLYFLSNGFAIFLLFMIFRTYIQKSLNLGIPPNFKYTWIVMDIYIFGIGFYGYRQKGIFSYETEKSSTFLRDKADTPGAEISGNQTLTGEKISYQKSGLKKEEIEELSKNLLNLMENKKPYLDCELNLAVLAEKLETTPHKLSQILNVNFNKNFFDFINDFRIEEAKKLLSSPEKSNYKIIAIAYDSGFNSKSTFYTVFKKSTSLTPSEYRSRLKNN